MSDWASTLPDPDWRSRCGSLALYHADWHRLWRSLREVSHAVVTDPPYGMAYQPVRGRKSSKRWKRGVAGDTEPFNPQPVLSLAKPTILWGANHYHERLPQSAGWMVWNKAPGGVREGFNYSHADLAWSNFLTRIHLYEHNWQGKARDGEPYWFVTQKPEGLMRWCLELLPPGCDIICDPYLGSGTTAVAAIQTCRCCIGCESDDEAFEIAVRRLTEASEHLYVQPAQAQREQLFTEAGA